MNCKEEVIIIRVLHFIPGFNFGGIETIFKNNFQIIDNQIVEMELIVETLASKESIKELETMGCKVYVIPRLRIKNIFQYIGSINEIIKLNNKTYDAVHSYNIMRTPIFFFIALINGINNRIYHARTNKTTGSRLLRTIYRFFIFLGRSLATKLIANSEEAGLFFFNKKDFFILNNGIDTKKYSYNLTLRNKLRNEMQVNNILVIGHVGRFTEAKNHDFLIELFHEYLKVDSHACLLLVGDGPLLGSIKKQIEELDISDKVLFTGAVNNVEDYYQIMDYFVFPSVYEGFGNVVIEAQAAGLRVLASTQVPKSTKVSNLVEFLSLKDQKEIWVNKIIETKKYTRKDMHEKVVNSNYDINENAKVQEKIYMSFKK